MNRVVLYGKPDCSLCARVREILRRLRQDREFDLEEVDITLDPARFEHYRDWIPIVTVDGAEAMRGIPNEFALRLALGLEV
ncbi:MAG: glutaredoxin family protein [Dehalococcoidia bacterium]|nr:glutaredoxin family protein [Dehalococcoidia bacterium]